MSNDKQCLKTLSPKVQGFSGKDKPPAIKTVPKKKTKVVFNGNFLLSN